jgi:hypothetical protein
MGLASAETQQIEIGKGGHLPAWRDEGAVLVVVGAE